MEFDSGKVKRSLQKKGFVEDDSDHKLYVLYLNDERTSVWTCLSHNGQSIGEDLISKMRRQLHLSKDDFVDLIKCPLSKEEYLDKLIKSGILILK